MFGYSPVVVVALFGFVPVSLALISWLGPRRGLISVFLLGWLFLPMAGIGIPGLPDYTKVSAISISAVLGVLCFDSRALSRYRFSTFDVPIVIWCLAPSLSSLANGLGPWDAISVMADQVLKWGVPYVLGRIYIQTPRDHMELAVAVLIGGLIYAPLCLWEIRMSPQLHRVVYGFHQHVFAQTKRFGGWRPMVFLQHGLAVGLFMSCATLVAWQSWRSRARLRIWIVPMSLVFLALAGVTFASKSVGSLAILAYCVGAAIVAKHSKSRWPLLALAATPAVYMLVRSTGVWSGDVLMELAREIVPSRASSLGTRLRAEDLLAQRAWQQPLFGWGSWGRHRVVTREGFDIAVTDGFWIITFGKNGYFGLTAFLAAMLTPVVRVFRRVPASLLFKPQLAGPLCSALLVVMFLLDLVLNAHPNPMFTLAAGGLAALPVRSASAAVPRMTRRLGPRIRGPAEQRDSPARGADVHA